MTQAEIRIPAVHIVNDSEVEQLLALVRRENIRLFYARMPAQFGVINPDAQDPTGG